MLFFRCSRASIHLHSKESRSIGKRMLFQGSKSVFSLTVRQNIYIFPIPRAFLCFLRHVCFIKTRRGSRTHSLKLQQTHQILRGMAKNMPHKTRKGPGNEKPHFLIFYNLRIGTSPLPSSIRTSSLHK